MPTVKIILDPHEDEVEACECLAKALTQMGGNARFDDPVLDQVEQVWNKEYQRMLKSMFDELETAVTQGV